MKTDNMGIDRESNLEPAVENFSNETARIVDIQGASENDLRNNEASSNNCKILESKQHVDDTKQTIKCEPSSSCQQTSKHIAIKVEPPSSSLPTSQKQDSSDNDAENIRQSILNLIDDIFHAFICKNGSCRRKNCTKMKWTILHSKTCKDRLSNLPCISCTHLCMIMVYHAHICKVPESSIRCTILKCRKFKTHIRKIKLKQREANKSLSSLSAHSNDTNPVSEMEISNVSTSFSDSSTFNCDGTMIVIKSEADTTDTDTK